ncbi:MAG: hypothetical protein LBF72_00785 [Holosporales bacterium]|jgi:TPR repeat protein|nr:hypothetical protein [Holosporales bacterium]
MVQKKTKLRAAWKVAFCALSLVYSHTTGNCNAIATKVEPSTLSSTKNNNNGNKTEESQVGELAKNLIFMGDDHKKNGRQDQADICYKAASALVNGVTANSQSRPQSNQFDNVDPVKEKKIKRLTEEVKKGNADAAYKLAKIYLKDNNIKEAMQMLEMAYSQKHPKAIRMLASLFEKGELVEMDLAKAEELYKKGAENGDPECQYIVAKLLEMEAQKTHDKQLKNKVLSAAYQLKIAAAKKLAKAAFEVACWYSAQGNPFEGAKYFKKARKLAAFGETIMLSLKEWAEYAQKSEKLKAKIQDADTRKY